MLVSAIIAAGGRGARLGAAVPKQMLELGGRSILERSFELFEAHERVNEVVVALPRELAERPPAFLRSDRKPVRVVDGGDRRQDSVANAFAKVSPDTGIIVIHDAARPFASAGLISRVIDAAAEDGAAIAALKASDTIKEASVLEGRALVARTLERDAVYLAQTPQAFARTVLEKAIAHGSTSTATDEAFLAEQIGQRVRLVDGEPTNIKITTEQDLRLAQSLVPNPQSLIPNPQAPIPRIGVGYDLHRLEAGRALIIGGVAIPFDKGLAGHSDADVLCHAITDALLGAASEGDIGRHFPDTDPQWKGADSLVLLRKAVQILGERRFRIVNIDAVVIAERPKLSPYVDAIRAKLAGTMGIEPALISVKGKTNETVGPLGAGEAIAVHAVALIVNT